MIPRTLVITDVDLRSDSRGAGRTLLNLLHQFPADRVLAITTAELQEPDRELGFTLRDAPYPHWLRLFERFRPVLGDPQALWQYAVPVPHAARIRAFAPELLLLVPTGSGALVLGMRVVRALKLPFICYVMDDWFDNPAAHWLGDNAAAAATRLLRGAAGWLAVSDALLDSMAARTGARPAHTAVVHNPVPIPLQRPAALDVPCTGPFSIGYAGSLFPMHIDAVMAVAESAARLRATGTPVRFTLYTDHKFWGNNEATWTALGVENGGLLPYEQLHERLREHDLLLVASSFRADQAQISRASLQTKVTDYMLAGRPILACGPSYAASNLFLRQHDCALFAEDPAPDAIDVVLRTAIANRAANAGLARRAFEIVVRDHSGPAVAERMAEVLRAAVTSR